jgi:hypothetical protein
MQLQDFSNLGVNPALAQGLAPGYGNQVFQNLQLAAQGGNQANRQNILDSTGRFGQMGSGMQQKMLQQNNQGSANQMMGQMGQAQAQGAQAGLQNRQFNTNLQFQAQQNALQRQLAQQQLAAQLQQEQSQFDVNRADTGANRMWNLASGVIGGGMALGMGGKQGLMNYMGAGNGS